MKKPATTASSSHVVTGPGNSGKKGAERSLIARAKKRPLLARSLLFTASSSPAKKTPDYNLSQKNFPALQDNTSLTLSVPEFCSRRHKLVLAQIRKLIVEETEGIWRKKWFFLRSGN